MYLKHDVTAEELKAFLAATDYPCEWDQELLARCCHMTRIEAPCGSVAGYFWVHGIKDSPGVLDFHIAIHPDFQRRLPRSLSVDVIVLMRSLGARTLLARPISNDHAALLLRFGYSLHGPLAVLPINPLSESIHPAIRRAVLRKERPSHG